MASPPRTAPRPNRAVNPSRQSAKPKRGFVSAKFSLGRVFRAESVNFYFLAGITAILIIIGLFMVLSASSVDSFLAEGQFFGAFGRQFLSVIIALPFVFWISRLGFDVYRRTALFIMLGALVFQLLVFTPLGYDSGGNRNWLDLGFITVQPSEFLKLATAIWLGVRLPSAIAQYGTKHWKVLLPIVPPALGMLFVVLGSDLGTVMILGLIVMGALFFSGISFRIILIPGLVAAFGVLIAVVSSPNRMARILASMGTTCVDYTNACWQPLHGKWALASGGIFGVGLGNSKAKWSWLPAADNDYIFAIIGEELGLIGAIVVVGLYVAMAVMFLRIIRSARDPLVRISTGGIMIWIIGQAFINIAVVLGLLPVLGVPLPLVSSGGTALIAGLLAIGVVLSFTRDEEPVHWGKRK